VFVILKNIIGLLVFASTVSERGSFYRKMHALINFKILPWKLYRLSVRVLRYADEMQSQVRATDCANSQCRARHSSAHVAEYRANICKVKVVNFPLPVFPFQLAVGSLLPAIFCNHPKLRSIYIIINTKFWDEEIIHFISL
jgi:hypothetical protein